MVVVLAILIQAALCKEEFRAVQQTRSLSSAVSLQLMKLALPFRYKIQVHGIDEIEPAQPGQGTLILPNHPGLIDPMVLLPTLDGDFHPRPVMHSKVLRYPLMKQVSDGTRGILIPEMSEATTDVSQQAEAAMNEAISALKHGENVMMWAAGQIQREAKEYLGSKSGVQRILSQVPNTRVVLVRTEGLWGSRFSYGATGSYPKPMDVFTKTLPIFAAANLGIFGPRRPVDIHLASPKDFPRSGSATEINRYLEKFYNEHISPNTSVPLFWWQGRQAKILPEPASAHRNGHSDASNVSQIARDGVLKILRDRKLIAATQSPNDSDRLSDLGLDSLSQVDFILEIEKQFGVSIPNGEGIITVADALRAADGKSISVAVDLKPVPKKWVEAKPSAPEIVDAKTIPEAFLKLAQKYPNRVILADQISGAKTYRELLAGIILLKPIFEAMPGERIGIMLPASVSATTFQLAAQFAGKVPVMLNWTTGERNLKFAVEELGIQQIVIAEKLVQKLKSQGISLDGLSDKLFFAEGLAKKITKGQKLAAFARTFSPFQMAKLRRAKVNDVAVVLMTSGSESTPKAVPMTHQMQLNNVATFNSFVHFESGDRMLGFLPPFHSMGNTGLVVAPLATGLPVVYHSNPLDAPVLAEITKAYKPTIVAGAPSFLKSLAEAAGPEDLASLRLAVSGAEALTKPVVDLLASKNPKLRISEGYGITETGPLISATPPGKERMGAVGFPVGWVSFMLLNQETNEILMKGRSRVDASGHLQAPAIELANGRKGILYVAGNSVMPGYLTKESKSPFMQHEGRVYYNTGDIIRVDEDGYFWVEGRVKEMVKIGGEMVSLAAIRKVLTDQFGSDAEGLSIAVGADERSERPQIVLVTTQKGLTQEVANQQILKSGLNGLHRVSKVLLVPEIPILGTGKVDSQKIRQLIKESP